MPVLSNGLNFERHHIISRDLQRKLLGLEAFCFGTCRVLSPAGNLTLAWLYVPCSMPGCLSVCMTLIQPRHRAQCSKTNAGTPTEAALGLIGIRLWAC